MSNVTCGMLCFVLTAQNIHIVEEVPFGRAVSVSISCQSHFRYRNVLVFLPPCSITGYSTLQSLRGAAQEKLKQPKPTKSTRKSRNINKLQPRTARALDRPVNASVE